MTTTESRPVLVRMAPDVIAALDERAKQMTKREGIYYTRSDMVRFAVHSYLNLKLARRRK